MGGTIRVFYDPDSVPLYISPSARMSFNASRSLSVRSSSDGGL